MKYSFDGVVIESIIGVLPSHYSEFDSETKNYAQSSESSAKLKALMGYNKHHIVVDDITTCDLTVLGFKKLLQEKLVTASQVDALIFVSQTPDYILPSTSSVLHGLLDLPSSTYCVDINDGCCGYITGLYQAFSFLSCSSGSCVLLVCGDVLSPYVSIYDRNSYPLVGDAVTLTVIKKVSPSTTSKASIEILKNGKEFDSLIIPSGGSRHQPILPLEYLPDEDGNRRTSRQLTMKGRDVFAFTQSVVPEFIENFLLRHSCSTSDLSRLYLHQANSFILNRLRTRLSATSEQLPDIVATNYGNSSSATIPLSIAVDDPPLPSPVLLCGFGVGLTWGACLLNLPYNLQRHLHFV